MGQSLEETRHKLPRVLCQQSQRMALHKQEGVEIMLVKGYLPGKLLVAQHPAFLYTEIPDFQKEGRCSA